MRLTFCLAALLASIMGVTFSWIWLRPCRAVSKRVLIGLAVLALPLSCVGNLLLKRPVHEFFQEAWRVSDDPKSWPFWFVILAIAVAPLVEEPLKAIPLLIPFLRRLSRSTAAAAIGFVVGAGFGVGEAWFLAYRFSVQYPHEASGSIWQVTGFIGERAAVIPIHGLLTGLTYLGYRRRQVGRFLLLSMILHYMMNFTAGLYLAGRFSTLYTAIGTVIAVIAILRIYMHFQSKPSCENDMSVSSEILFRRHP